jgi:hypothetical protein
MPPTIQIIPVYLTHNIVWYNRIYWSESEKILEIFDKFTEATMELEKG